MSHDEKITNNVKEEFEAFKKEQISKSPITVFENAGKIHFYEEIFDYVTYNTLSDIFSTTELKRLADCKCNLIRLLYKEYLSEEHLSITNWATIKEIFESFLH